MDKDIVGRSPKKWGVKSQGIGGMGDDSLAGMESKEGGDAYPINGEGGI